MAQDPTASVYRSAVLLLYRPTALLVPLLGLFDFLLMVNLKPGAFLVLEIRACMASDFFGLNIKV